MERDKVEKECRHGHRPKRVFQDTAAGSLELSYWSEGVGECTETRGKGGRGGIGPGPARAGETTAWGMKIEGYTGV